jgi:hypothetical protein
LRESRAGFFLVVPALLFCKRKHVDVYCWFFWLL